MTASILFVYLKTTITVLKKQENTKIRRFDILIASANNDGSDEYAQTQHRAFAARIHKV